MRGAADSTVEFARGVERCRSRPLGEAVGEVARVPGPHRTRRGLRLRAPRRAAVTASGASHRSVTTSLPVSPASAAASRATAGVTMTRRGRRFPVGEERSSAVDQCGVGLVGPGGAYSPSSSGASARVCGSSGEPLRTTSLRRTGHPSSVPIAVATVVLPVAGGPPTRTSRTRPASRWLCASASSAAASTAAGGFPACRAGRRSWRARARDRRHRSVRATRARSRARRRGSGRGSGARSGRPSRSRSIARNATSPSTSPNRSRSSNSRQSRIRGPSSRQKMSSARRSP